MTRSAPDDAPKKSPARRGKWPRRFAILFALYTVFGFLLLPALLKWQLQKQLPKFTHRTAQVDAVRVNPFALSLGLRGLVLTEADGSTFASFSNFYVNFEAVGSLLNRAWTFDEVQLGTPYGYVAILTNGQFNFASLLTNAPTTNTAPAQARTPPPVLVKTLVITNGTFAVADFYRAAPFHTQFTPIDVRLTNFTTRPRTGSPYAFTASTGEGEYFNWSGSVHAIPPTSSGKFELGGIDLKKYGTYLREFTQLDVRDGKLTVGATYTFALETNGLELTVTNGGVLLTNLLVFAPGTPGGSSNALVSIPSVAVRGAEADLQRRAMKVREVETVGGSIFVRRFKDGALELLELAAPPTNRAPSILNPPRSAASVPPATNAPATPWSMVVESIVVNDYAVRVNDEQPPRPARLDADQISLAVKNLSLASNAPLSVQFSTRVNGGGTVKVNSQGTVLPVALEADVDVSGIELRPFQPYVEQQRVKLAFNSGRVSTKGHVALALRGTNPPDASFTGDVVLDDVAVADQIAFQDLVKWKQVAVRGIDFSLEPMRVKVGELACDELITSVVLGTNRQLTALAVLPPANTNAAPPAPKPALTSAELLPFPVQLDVFALTNASIRFADLSIDPNCRFAVQQFGGTVRGLSSALNSTATVDISGRVNESAPFSIAGKVNPLVRDLLVDLVISNRSMDLTAFTPYLEKFAGHPLAKGKVSLGLQYSIKNQALESQNVIWIDQLTLGPKNASPDATKLPVKLGVALLKDREGRIALDVPVKGRLDDPKFRVVPVIWQVVMNLLVKAAASPFSLLGALVGGGEELSYIEFAPGQNVIATNEFVKIGKLGQALHERPALNLEISGAADDSLDRAALAWLKLERALKTARLAELTGKSDAPATVEAVRLEPREHERLLKARYQKVFQRDRPLPTLMTNAATGEVVATAPGLARPDARKGAEAQVARAVTTRPAPKDTNSVAMPDPRAATRPATWPKHDAGDTVLAQMESELLADLQITAEEMTELKQSRAQSVQRALLKTEKVTAERLFIIAPLPAGEAVKGQSRANLSLN